MIQDDRRKGLSNSPLSRKKKRRARKRRRADGGYSLKKRKGLRGKGGWLNST